MCAMDDRRLNRRDRAIAGIDSFLRGLAGPTRVSRRPNPAAGVLDAPLSARERRQAAALMRVNHAGELAAQGLYQGHAAVARSDATAEQMRKAASEELDHLSWCEQRLAELDGRPSRLKALWYAGAWGIGAASGMLGDRWSLGFVEETERQVSEHLAGHLNRLPAADQRSRAIVARMREEEEQHGANARAAGARPLPRIVHRLMRLSANVMKRTAYRL
jgi:3-demethoxyubiquinol 3-hydroxylase